MRSKLGLELILDQVKIVPRSRNKNVRKEQIDEIEWERETTSRNAVVCTSMIVYSVSDAEIDVHGAPGGTGS